MKLTRLCSHAPVAALLPARVGQRSGGWRPRKGCFEVILPGGKVALSLTGLKRPFKPLKALDMEDEIEKILAKLA